MRAFCQSALTPPASVAMVLAVMMGGPALADEDAAGFYTTPVPYELTPRGDEFGLFLPRFFLEAGVSVLTLDLTTPSGASATGEDSRTGGTLRGGLAFNEFFAVEIDATYFETETAFVVPADGTAGGFEVAADPDQLAVGYGRLSYPLGRFLAVHGRLGYATLDSEVASSGVDDDHGVAAGAGVRFGAVQGRGLGLRVDYTRLSLDTVDADIGTLVFTFQY